ncbi:hypothetical protein SAMN05444008_11342 [Cnuella takakiae]|uniref:Uncharacterized protein n=1 Tax=Cnuella takakiae TaxID=1302690 RepID=A0A1M5F4X5_9BACT|nr:hypothetical protein SAMN05444008_11342 [Cnuella takakiae]
MLQGFDMPMYAAIFCNRRLLIPRRCRNKFGMTVPIANISFPKDEGPTIVEPSYKSFIEPAHHQYYSASATTSFTSGIIRFIMPSIPAFSVIMLEGQPEQEPWSIRLTIPSL